MRTLPRYVLFEWILSFIAVYLVATAILLLEDAYNYLHAFIRANIGAADIARYTSGLAVTFVPLIVPIAIFFSSIISFGRLHRNNEITAMRSTGMSLWGLSRPVIVFGAIISTIAVYLEINVIPSAMENVHKCRLSTEQAANRTTNVRRFGFHNARDKRIWAIANIDEKTFVATDVMVSCFDNNWNETKRIFAESAHFDISTGKWTFNTCKIAVFDEGSNTPSKIQLLDGATFEEFCETPHDLLVSTKKLKHLSFSEITSAIKYSDITNGSGMFLVKLHRTFSGIVTNVLIMVLAIPFAASGIRVNALKNITKGVLLVGVFFALNTAFSVLGNNNVISAVVAAWAGNALMFFPAIYFFQKSA